MRTIHRNLALSLRWARQADGRWLVLGRPPNRGYSNNRIDGRGDERQVESAYAEGVLERYLGLRRKAWLVHALDLGASVNPEAERIRRAWEGHRIEWSAVDVAEITHDMYLETWQGVIGEMSWDEFDFILNVSVIEHSAWVGDDPHRAMNRLRGALSDRGVMVLTLPMGIKSDYQDFHQFSAREARELLAGFQVIDERFWRWEGQHFENCEAEDTAGCLYGRTNNALCAAGVGAWTLAR